MGVTRGSRDPILELWDPLRISRTVEARNSKFGMQVDPRGTIGKNEKLVQWGARGGHVTQFWNYGTPRISRTVEARHSKFGMQVDPRGTIGKK